MTRSWSTRCELWPFIYPYSLWIVGVGSFRLRAHLTAPGVSGFGENAYVRNGVGSLLGPGSMHTMTLPAESSWPGPAGSWQLEHRPTVRRSANRIGRACGLCSGVRRLPVRVSILPPVALGAEGGQLGRGAPGTQQVLPGERAVQAIAAGQRGRSEGWPVPACRVLGGIPRRVGGRASGSKSSLYPWLFAHLPSPYRCGRRRRTVNSALREDACMFTFV